ncbi:hypothetical protein JG687_00004397, partial [Phytophthora cactorum]
TAVFTGDSLRDTVADAVKLAKRFGCPPPFDISPVSFRFELLDFIGMKKSSKLRNSLRVSTVEKLSFIYTNDGDTKPTDMPLYQTPSRSSDCDSDDNGDDDNDECLFDLSDVEFELLLDAIVSVDIAADEDSTVT